MKRYHDGVRLIKGDFKRLLEVKLDYESFFVDFGHFPFEVELVWLLLSLGSFNFDLKSVIIFVEVISFIILERSEVCLGPNVHHRLGETDNELSSLGCFFDEGDWAGKGLSVIIVGLSPDFICFSCLQLQEFFICLKLV